jgi:RHS repeat-associated protein
MGRKSRFTYDLLNQVTQITDALGGLTQFGYDAIGNLLSVTDARSNVTAYVYSNMDRVTSRTDPLTRAETYGYDNNGNRTSSVDRKSQATTSTYDGLDRRTLITYADSSTTSYTYDAGNRITQIVDSIGGTIAFTYDGLDRLLTETTSLGTVTYTYDAAGRRVTMSVPGQNQITYGYDNADQLTSITQNTSVVSFTYDSAGRRMSHTLPNGIVTEYGYDAASRLTGLTYKLGGTTLGNLSYTYNAAEQRIAAGGTWARSGQPTAVLSATYNAANHQVTFGMQTPTYDLNGNLTSDGTNTYTWNARNRLAAINGPTPATFLYDGLGRRKQKTINGATTDFVYDGLNPVQEQTVGATANLLTGLGIDERFVRSDSTEVRHVLTDAVGSTLALADGTGTVQVIYTYEAFGAMGVTGSSSNRYTFTGREDDGTGLYYYRARYYSRNAGRFITEDPSGFHDREYNLFAYAANNPVSFNDPLGLWKNPKRVYDEADDAAQRSEIKDPAQNDAYKHCLASCVMTAENYEPAARFFGWANEVWGDAIGQQSGDRKMDDHNNARGRKFGMTAKCSGVCDKACRAGLFNGTLSTTGYHSGNTTPLHRVLRDIGRGGFIW